MRSVFFTSVSAVHHHSTSARNRPDPFSVGNRDGFISYAAFCPDPRWLLGARLRDEVMMPVPPKLTLLCVRALGKAPEHITSLDECDLKVTGMLLMSVLKHGKLDPDIAKKFYATGHPEVQKWLKDNLTWPYNEALDRP